MLGPSDQQHGATVREGKTRYQRGYSGVQSFPLEWENLAVWTVALAVWTAEAISLGTHPLLKWLSTLGWLLLDLEHSGGGVSGAPSQHVPLWAIASVILLCLEDLSPFIGPNRSFCLTTNSSLPTFPSSLVCVKMLSVSRKKQESCKSLEKKEEEEEKEEERVWCRFRLPLKNSSLLGWTYHLHHAVCAILNWELKL